MIDPCYNSPDTVIRIKLLKYIRKEDGFRDQELYVIPPDVTGSNSLSVLIRNLIVTDAGFFPRAAGHQKNRSRGIDEGILLYCLEGQGFIHVDQDPTLLLGKDQACYIKPGVPHIYGSSDIQPWSLYWMHIKGDLLDSYTSILDGHKGIIPLCSRTVEQLSQLFQYLLESMSDGYSRETMVQSGQLACSILTTLLYGNRDFHRDISSLNLRRIDKIIQRMRKSLEEGQTLSLDDMASFLGLSVPHFSDVFKKAKGYSPIEYYSRMRVQKSCRLLEISDMDIQEVAYQSGYKDRYYFSRVFKKIMGLSPTQYREKVNQSIYRNNKSATEEEKENDNEKNQT